MKAITSRVQSHLRSGDFSKLNLVITFVLPLVLVFVFTWIAPEYKLSGLGIIMFMLLPVMTSFVPPTFQPIPSLFPHYWINTRFLALVFIAISQLIIICEPEYVPIFAEGETEFGGYISKRTVYAILVMFFCHSAFYYMGFFWNSFERDLPDYPIVNNNLTTVFVSIYVIFVIPLTFLPSKDFLYLTPGYVTYHTVEKRFWYHFGGWSWIWIVTSVSKFFGNSSYEHPGLFLLTYFSLY